MKRKPALFADGNGFVNCGVCGHIAMAVRGKDTTGR
jgi:hypothetical protein